MFGFLAVLSIAASTVVAWGCVLWSPLRDSRPLTAVEATDLITQRMGTVRDHGRPRGTRNDGPGWAAVFASDATIPAPPRPTRLSKARGRRSSGHAFTQIPIHPDDKQVEIFTAGWPLSCLEGQRTTRGTTRRPHGLVEPPGLVRDLGVKPMRLVPLRPRWGGLAVNAIFYTAVFWLAVPGPLALRRRLRRRRGACPHCGYDVAHAEHDACPECGRP